LRKKNYKDPVVTVFEIILKLTLCPAGIFRLRLEITHCFCSSYFKETSSNTMSPFCGQDIGTDLPIQTIKK
jgi:hypothetical protein